MPQQQQMMMMMMMNLLVLVLSKLYLQMWMVPVRIWRLNRSFVCRFLSVPVSSSESSKDGASPPKEPAPEECCGNDCVHCVWIQYWEALEEYKRKEKKKKEEEMESRTEKKC